MTGAALALSLQAHGPRLQPARRDDPAHPQPGTRGEVPKPQGGIRTLGVPPVGDRFLPPAVRQGLQAPGEPTGSAARSGFRPGRQAHHAIQRAPSSRNAGDPGVVAMDLETCVDRVTHDTGMREVSTRVRARRVWPRIHRGLKAGAMALKARQETVAGGPQGGLLSP